MLEINVKEVRKNLSSILSRAEQGEEIIITRRGKKIVRMSSIEKKPKHLESLKRFRDTIRVEGKSMSETVISNREEERF